LESSSALVGIRTAIRGDHKAQAAAAAATPTTAAKSLKETDHVELSRASPPTSVDEEE